MTTPSKKKLVYVGTVDILEDFRENMATLSNVNYDLEELGSVLIESYQTTPPDDPHQHHTTRDLFSEHFARGHGERDHDLAFVHYSKFFDRMFERLDGALMHGLSEEGRHMAFAKWVNDDVAVLLYDPKCE